MNKNKKTDINSFPRMSLPDDEGLSLKSCIWNYRKRRSAADIRRDMGTDWNDKRFWKSRTPFPWAALAAFLLLLIPYAIKHYAPEFYVQYELAFDIWSWATLAFFVVHILWRWWRRAPRRRYEVAVGACFIMGVIWTVMPCYNLLRGMDDPTAQYQLLAAAGVSWVLMFVFHYLWRRVRNRSAAEIQNFRAKARRNNLKNL